jgi:hypothetical protein
MMLVSVAKFCKALIADVLITYNGGRHGYTFYFRPGADRFFLLAVF